MQSLISSKEGSLSLPNESKSGLTPQFFLKAVIILIVAAAGVYFGYGFRSDDAEEPTGGLDVFSNLALKVGTEFPDLPVIDTTFDTRSSRSLLNPNGTVVLFTDDGCSPCQSNSINWQRLIDDGDIDRAQVIGITFDAAGSLTEMSAHYGITFDIYSDEDYAFMNQYGVDAFPLILIVSKSGIIRHVEYDSRRKFDSDDLQRFFSD